MRKKHFYIKPEMEELLSGTECILCVSGGNMSGGVNWGDGTQDEGIDKEDENSGGPV